MPISKEGGNSKTKAKYSRPQATLLLIQPCQAKITSSFKRYWLVSLHFSPSSHRRPQIALHHRNPSPDFQEKTAAAATGTVEENGKESWLSASTLIWVYSLQPPSPPLSTPRGERCAEKPPESRRPSRDHPHPQQPLPSPSRIHAAPLEKQLQREKGEPAFTHAPSSRLPARKNTANVPRRQKKQRWQLSSSGTLLLREPRRERSGSLSTVGAAAGATPGAAAAASTFPSAAPAFHFHCQPLGRRRRWRLYP